MLDGAPLTLASQSPRRRELLAQLGIRVLVEPADADETIHGCEPAVNYVQRVALAKARAVAGETVLAADTVVVLDGSILGKPRDAEDARHMLRALSGREHEVMTGVHGRRGNREETLTVASTVRIAHLEEPQIAWYVGTGEPLDKAGAYAVQGAGGVFVEQVRGSISNVVGLPLHETLSLLARLGFALPWG
ncbi:MAG TPA: Maf family protein [Anaeromyxobacteraceae bacterium]|nr:Maf family protein [Anaeromyxobacteraceae bacterium]